MILAENPLLVYGKAGRPTAATVTSEGILIDTTMYFIKCREINEARYLSAIINSQALYDKAQALMPKGQYGPRDVHKHIWRLTIPAYDQTQSLHRELAVCGIMIEREVMMLATQQSHPQSVRAYRAMIRDWQRSAPISREAEALVARLLSI